MLQRSDDVYVVVVNYNGSRDTIECLESLLLVDYGSVKIVVVDNASTDASAARILEWAHARQLQHVRLSEENGHSESRSATIADLTLIEARANRGFAAGNNIAFRYLLDANASGYVCLVNNDMTVAPDAISALVRQIRDSSDTGAVGGVILDYNERDKVQIVGGGRMSPLGTSSVFGAGAPHRSVERPRDLGYITGGLLLTRLETVQEVGLMDENFFLYAEDADWGHRMRRKQYRLTCALDSVVWHKGSQSTGAGSPFQDYHIVRSSLRFVRKHHPQLLLIAIPHSLFRFLLPKLIRRQWSRARSVAKAHRDAFQAT